MLCGRLTIGGEPLHRLVMGVTSLVMVTGHQGYDVGDILDGSGSDYGRHRGIPTPSLPGLREKCPDRFKQDWPAIVAPQLRASQADRFPPNMLNLFTLLGSRRRPVIPDFGSDSDSEQNVSRIRWFRPQLYIPCTGRSVENDNKRSQDTLQWIGSWR